MEGGTGKEIRTGRWTSSTADRERVRVRNTHGNVRIIWISYKLSNGHYIAACSSNTSMAGRATSIFGAAPPRGTDHDLNHLDIDHLDRHLPLLDIVQDLCVQIQRRKHILDHAG